MFYAEIHFPIDVLFDGIYAFEDLRHGLDEALAADAGALGLELGEQLGRGHRLARQVAPHRLLGHAALAAPQPNKRLL